MRKKRSKAADIPIADVLRVLRSMALMGLRGAVAEFDRRGKDFREQIYFFFDASPPTLFRLATSIIQLEDDVSAEEARHQLEEALAEAERNNRLLGMGTTLPPDLFMRLLADISGPDVNLGLVETWLTKPSPRDHMRMVMMARSKLAAEHVPIVRAN